MESRLAVVPVKTIPANATRSDSGMTREVIIAARKFPRNMSCTPITKSIPVRRFSRTVWLVTLTRLSRS
jgi:hypothetical protein